MHAIQLSTLLVPLLCLFSRLVLAATLQGSGKITPQDYYGLPSHALQNNPPSCGMPYAELNLARITAVQNMDNAATCNLCLKVSNEDKSKNIYVLAVDLGGQGLDLSIPAFEYLFGQRYDASFATWETVDNAHCDGIYTPGKTNTNQGINSSSANSSTTTTSRSASPRRTTTATDKKRTAMPTTMPVPSKTHTPSSVAATTTATASKKHKSSHGRNKKKKTHKRRRTRSSSCHRRRRNRH